MHLSRINFGGSATASIRAKTYTLEVMINFKTAFGKKDVPNKMFIKLRWTH